MGFDCIVPDHSLSLNFKLLCVLSPFLSAGGYAQTDQSINLP